MLLAGFTGETADDTSCLLEIQNILYKNEK